MLTNDEKGQYFVQRFLVVQDVLPAADIAEARIIV